MAGCYFGYQSALPARSDVCLLFAWAEYELSQASFRLAPPVGHMKSFGAATRVHRVECWLFCFLSLDLAKFPDQLIKSPSAFMESRQSMGHVLQCHSVFWSLQC